MLFVDMCLSPAPSLSLSFWMCCKHFILCCSDICWDCGLKHVSCHTAPNSTGEKIIRVVVALHSGVHWTITLQLCFELGSRCKQLQPTLRSWEMIFCSISDVVWLWCFRDEDIEKLSSEPHVVLISGERERERERALGLEEWDIGEEGGIGLGGDFEWCTSATTSEVQEVRSAQLLQVECTCPLVAPQASWIVHWTRKCVTLDVNDVQLKKKKKMGVTMASKLAVVAAVWSVMCAAAHAQGFDFFYFVQQVIDWALSHLRFFWPSRGSVSWAECTGEQSRH